MRLLTCSLALVFTSAAPLAAQNLVHYFRLDESSGTNVTEAGPAGLSGTIQGTGSANWVQGWVGGGLDLPGTGATYVRFPADPIQDITTLTITAWVKVDVAGDWDGILTKGTTESPYALQLGFPLNTFKLSLNWGSPPGAIGSGTFNSTGSLTPGQWHHLAATYDSTVVTLYLDGQVDSTFSATNTLLGATTEDLTLGGDLPGGQEYFDGVIDEVRLYDGPLPIGSIQALMGASLGTRYCTPNIPNTTGLPGVLDVNGSDVAAEAFIALTASSLPAGQFGIFIVSDQQSFLPNPGGSQGTLCLGGAIGRYNGPGQLGNSGTDGSFSLGLDLTATPSPTGPFAITAGQTFHFQAWYRDFITGQGATSNFTDAVTVAFQ